MRFAVRNVDYRGLAHATAAIVAAGSGMLAAALQVRGLLAGSPALTVLLASSIAVGIAMHPRARARLSDGRDADIELDPEAGTLRADGRLFGVRDFVGAWTEADGARVLLRDGLGRTLSFDARSPEDAERFFSAAALGAGVRVTRIPVGGARTRVGAAVLAMLVIVFGVIAFLVLGAAALGLAIELWNSSLGTSDVLVLAIFAVVGTFSLFLGHRAYRRVRVLDVVIGRDGILLPRLLRRPRQLALPDVVAVYPTDDAVALVLEFGAVALPAANREQGLALATAIETAQRRYVSNSTEDRRALERDGRSADAWAEYLRAVASNLGTYRGGAHLDELMAIAEDPVVDAEHRVAAALVVGAAAEAHRPRLRVAAEGTVDDDLRAAMLHAIDAAAIDEDALSRALRRSR